MSLGRSWKVLLAASSVSFSLAMGLVSVPFGTLGSASPAAKIFGQEQPPADTKNDEKNDEKNEQPAGDNAEALNQQFQQLLEEWRGIIKELRSLKIRYQTANDAEAEALKLEWDKTVAKGETLLPSLRTAGKNAYLAAPNVDLQLTRMLVKFVEDDINRDDYEVAYDLAEALIEKKCEFKEIYNLGGIAAFCTNHFDQAEEYFKQAEQLGELKDDGAKFKPLVGKYKRMWEAEQALRSKEAEADDLPRVKISTNRGDVVIELFENEAPETVGNFVHLVDEGFYNGLSFHRVLKGFMAQGGCPRGDGSGGPGYKIYCECRKAEHRNHFRGSLSMAHAGQDTGGSQFFLTFVPTEHLNGRHTVFGRIVEGMDVLAKIVKRDPMGADRIEPDRIVKAEVIRKRDHKYEPNKVQ